MKHWSRHTIITEENKQGQPILDITSNAGLAMSATELTKRLQNELDRRLGKQPVVDATPQHKPKPGKVLKKKPVKKVVKKKVVKK